MPFDQTAVSGIQVARDGTDLLIAWDSADPDAIHHIYVDGRLRWTGPGTMTVLPWPGTPVSIDVGTVDDGEAFADHAAELPAPPQDRVTLTWTGGTYLDEDIAGFRVYASPTPGATIDFTAPLATVPAYVGPVIDGYGVGGYGAGGYGRGASYYSWRSGHLAPGVWRFTVVGFDQAGNEGDPVTAYTATIAGPPNPPAVGTDGLRLRILAYDPSTRVATLGWLASQ